MSTVANVQSRIAGLAGDSHTISGVAIGIGDVTKGLSGNRKVWKADHLRAAASTLEGTSINPLHSQADVGEVTRAGFDPGRGVVYEAELEDESLAQQAANGQLEVSIEAQHADGGTVETDRGEAMLATNIRFTGLSLVQHGAAPSASASPGEAAALSPDDIRDALADGNSENEASETANGADPEEDPAEESAAASTDDPGSPERGQGEVSTGGEPEGSTASEPTDPESHMGDNNDNDDLQEEVEELRARLSEKDDEIAKLQTEVEQYEEERAAVARAYAEALAAGDTVFDEDDLVEKFEVAELREKFENTEDATLADVEPAVQSGGSEPEEEAELSAAEEEEVAELRDNMAELAGSDTRLAEIQREQHADRIAELTGEDAEEILAEEA